MSRNYFHPTALVESESIGEGTRIWAFAHVLPDAILGSRCNIGDFVYVESGAVIGNNVTVKNHVCIWDGITVQDDVFIGPHVTFTNDLYPRSPRMEIVKERYASHTNWLVRTVIENGCSIGANATILGGTRLGQYCLIAAGATVTTDVEPFALMVGSPARRVGHVCRCGKRLPHAPTVIRCSHCGNDCDRRQTGTKS